MCFLVKLTEMIENGFEVFGEGVIFARHWAVYTCSLCNVIKSAGWCWALEPNCWTGSGFCHSGCCHKIRGAALVLRCPWIPGWLLYSCCFFQWIRGLPQSSWVSSWSSCQSGKIGGRQDIAQANLSRGMGMLTSADPRNIPSLQEAVPEDESEPISFAVVIDVV